MNTSFLSLVMAAGRETAGTVTSTLDAATTGQVNSERFDALATAMSTAEPFRFSHSAMTNGMLAIVFCGFMLHVAFEFWKQDGRLEFKGHVVRYIVFTTLILIYQPFSQTIAAFAMSMGDINTSRATDGAEASASFLAEQKHKFEEAKAETEKTIKEADALARANGIEDDRGTVERLVDGVGDSITAGIDGAVSSMLFHLMRLVVEGSFTFAAIALFFLKMLQSTMMKILFAVGPVMIAFSAWPGITSRYMTSWASALIETGAWGMVANALIAAMVGNVKAGGGDVADPNFFTYIGLNVLYAASLLSVPAITSSILRGSAGGGITAAGMWAAGVSAAASTGRMAANAAKSAGRGAGGPPKPPKPPEKPDDKPEPAPSRDSDKPADRAFFAKKGAINAQNREE